ncbi:hypothetical protein [Blastococcus sp. SYSU D00813]
MPRSVPALLLSVVYAAALAVAVTDLGQHAVAGLLVLGGLTARWFLRHRRTPAAAPAPAVRLAAVPDPVPAALDAVPAPARAA